METRGQFIKSERERIQKYIDSFVVEDFKAPPGSVSGYSAEYRCPCGFSCATAGEIHDHVQECVRNEQIEQCRNPTEGYSEWIPDAKVRVEDGDDQDFCTHCKRWKWTDERCEFFVEEPGALWDEIMGIVRE